MTSFGYDILGFGVGGSGTVTLTSTALINSLSNRSNVTTSSFITTNGTLIIPADFWLWASSYDTAALIVDTPNATIENSGNIVGKGASSNEGGNAISITASGVTIINNSGAYIAGGGGRGSQGRNGSGGYGAGGGGQTGTPTLGAAGANGANNGAGTGGGGGGAGGGGAAVTFEGGAGGGQGGYILPGSGGAGRSSGYGTAGNGGSAGNVGGNGTRGGNDSAGPLNSSGGGGGWGAAGGGNGIASSGSAGGKGIEANSNSFTLTNNGTIYGSQS